MPKRRETKRRVRRRKGARTHNAKSPDAEWEPRDALGKGQSGGVDELLDLLAESPISRRDALAQLLTGFAAAELSLAGLINVECEKSKRVAKRISTPFSPEELIEYQKSLAAVMAELVKKEELLLKKLRLILAYIGDADGDHDDDECDTHDDKWDDEIDELDYNEDED